MTALTVGWSNSAASLATANKLYSVAGSANSGYPHTASLVGTNVTGYGEVTSQGTSSAWAAAGSLPAPTGKGFLWDVTTLEGQTIAAGNWTPTVRLSMLLSGGTCTADIIVRASKRTSSGVYTTIMTSTLTAQSIAFAATTFNLPATSGSATDFATGDKLYIDVFCNVTTGPTGNDSLQINRLSNDTVGLTFDPNAQVVTPGYAATPTTTTYPFTEALVISDLGPALFSWHVDALTATESALFTDTDVPVEALVVSDLGGNLQLWPVDALVASDSLLGVDVAVPVEALSGVEVDLNTDVYGAIEALSVADSSTMVQSPLLTTTTYSFTDALVVADTFLAVDGSLYTESNSASDSMTTGQGGLFTESLSTSDSLLETDFYGPLDALTVSDLGNITRWPVDSLTASDGFVASDSYLPTEVQGVVDALLATDGAGWVDLLSVSDTSSMVSAASALLLYLSATWITRDGQAVWKTRDGLVTWKARDDQAGWKTRDETDTWKTRDEQATWKTRQ